MSTLRKENSRLKELVAETLLENRVLKKKRDRLQLGRGRYVRFTASAKMEVIRLVEGPDLSVQRTLRGLGIHRSTFYAWYRRYAEQGYEGLIAKKPARRRYWNRIPQMAREQFAATVREHTKLSPRELARRVTDLESHFLSESSVYRILRAYDLVATWWSAGCSKVLPSAGLP